MRILVISATSRETAPFSAWLQTRTALSQRVTERISGVGMLATAVNLAAALTELRPDFVVQAGIGGSFKGDDIGSTYAIGSERLGDLGVEEAGGFKSIFDLNLSDPDDFPFVQGTLPNLHADLIALSGCPARDAITVNEITTSSDRIHWLEQNTAAVVESMEGAALHYVCRGAGISFLQLRSISNKIGERDKTKWRMAEAIAGLNNALTALIEKLLYGHDAWLQPLP